MTKPLTKEVPSHAMRFDAGSLRFGDQDKEAKTAPIEMLARTSQPIDHWYWGKTVHDMSGFSADAERIPIDWSHDSYQDEGIGYLDKFSVDEDGLKVSGQLVSIEDDDRAAKLMKKSAAGVPYQASVFFREDKTEYVPEGFSTEVNGYTLEGPAVIFRQWGLRGVAVCLYGADHKSQTKFNASGDSIAVNVFTLEAEMAKTKKETAPAADPHKMTEEVSSEVETVVEAAVEQEAVVVTEPAAEVVDTRDELKQFTDAFGFENGARWFSEKLSFSKAQQKEIEALRAQIANLNEEKNKLSETLKSVDLGEENPVKFGTGESSEKNGNANATKFESLGNNLSRFASGIKLPTSKA